MNFVELYTNDSPLDLIEMEPVLQNVLVASSIYQQISILNEFMKTYNSLNLQREIMPLSPEKRNNEVLKIGSEYQIIICGYTRGPEEFFIQFAADNRKKLQDLKEMLMEVKLIPIIRRPCLNSNYLLVLEENIIGNELKIFRVVVKEIKGKDIIVQDLDEGCQRICSIDNIFELPNCVHPDHIPPICQKFSLEGINDLQNLTDLDEKEIDFYFKHITAMHRHLNMKIERVNCK